MTRKKIYPVRELTGPQEQSIPKRRTYDSIADSNESDANHAVQGLHSLTLNQSRSATGDSWASPTTEGALSPNGIAGGGGGDGNNSQFDALSPISILTPDASSTAPSLANYPYSSSRKRARTASQGEGSRNGDIVRPRSDLQGLLNPVEEGSQTYSPQLRLVDLDNPIRSSQPYSPSDGSPVAYRFGGPQRFADIQPRPEGTRPDDWHRGSQATVDGDEMKRKGRRGPLESDQRRAEVLEVREMGACLRCHIMRIRCEAVKDGPCKNCKDTLPKSRKWTVPCTREWLRLRNKYMIPEIIQQRHDPDRFHYFPTEVLGKPFKLELKHYIGFKCKIEVCEAKVTTNEMHHFNKVVVHQVGNDVNAVKQMIEGVPLPLVPADMRPGRESHERAVIITQNLLLKQVGELSQSWPSKVFPEEHGQEWAQQVLMMVVHFQYEVCRSTALHAALHACFIRVMMNYSFYVAPKRMAHVNNLLSPERRLPWNELEKMRNEKDVQIPKVVNRWLKSALVKIFDTTLKKLFTELELVFKLQENGGDQAKLSSIDRDEAFCAVVMTLIVTGFTQTSLLQGAMAWDTEVPESKGALEREARRCIELMETEVVDHILQLWKYRFQKPEMKGQPNPDRMEEARRAEKFGVIEHFGRLKDENAASILGIKTELDMSEGNLERFRTHNETRLLMKLSNAIWKPRGAKR